MDSAAPGLAPPAATVLAAGQPAPSAPASELDTLRAELDAMRDENAQLLLRLHQVQEELEDDYRQLGGHARGPGAAGAVRGSAQLIDLQDQGSHRHLDFEVRLDSAADGGTTKLRVRLLSHLNRPGLGLLARRSGERPLSTWQPTGLEDRREFMLLIPADDPGQALLRRMGSTDWRRVEDLSRLICRHVCSDDWALGAHWQATAARLCRQLADLPARWRYDDLLVSRDEPDGPPALDLHFVGATFGERRLDDVRLRWRLPDAERRPAGGSLHWRAPERAQALALGTWPTDADGNLADAFELPVGDGSPSGRRQRWARLSPVERELILALLDALPAAAERALELQLPQGLDPAALRRCALGWHKEARRDVLALRLRGAARRLLRRDPPGPGHAAA
jgi:hypothetical protein